MKWLRRTLLTIGIGALGYAGFAYLDQAAYQAYQEQEFDRETSGQAPGEAGLVKSDPPPRTRAQDPSSRGANNPRTVDRTLIGRIRIPRLHVRAMVREGVDDRTLRRAVGHLPGTARPGEHGNVALAGHRDSFFRSLQDIRRNDRIVVETLQASYEYVVYSLEIVEPADVAAVAPTRRPELTLVTCYPFRYIGNAPRRFIVRSRQARVKWR